MTDIPPSRLASPPRAIEPLLRSARLYSGLVMVAFVALHLLNHALALISLEAAEQGRLLFLALWRNPLGTTVLYGAVLVHAALALRSLYRRRTLAMPAREWAQLILGLAIPLFIVEHVVGTRVVGELFGIRDTYHGVVYSMWVTTPPNAARQVVATIVIWMHGCLGLYFWLRYRGWYRSAAPYLLLLAVFIPVVGLLGFADMGKTVSAIGPATPAIDEAVMAEATATRDRIEAGIYFGFAAVVAAVFAARLVRDRVERRNLIEVRYADGHTVRVPRGFSVLEASRRGGIPHYAVCGGRGRCSTCRVKVLEGLDEQPAPSAIEAATLARIEAEEGVRLACQLKPVRGLTIAPLLKPRVEREVPVAAAPADPGHEKVVAVMFCDMRSFTTFADQRLPFDVVFLLNRYFAVIGEAVERSGGRLDKFIGDGAMALFGLQSGPGEACRQAVTAAAAILEGVRHLSDDLAAELQASIRIAVGIHVGQTIVGTMGYGETMGVTAIGDAVNIGSRLEAVAKEFNADMVISEAAAKLSGLDFAGFESREVEVRGRGQPVRVLVVPRGAPLPG
jgi:adenylate cyclase